MAKHKMIIITVREIDTISKNNIRTITCISKHDIKLILIIIFSWHSNSRTHRLNVGWCQRNFCWWVINLCNTVLKPQYVFAINTLPFTYSIWSGYKIIYQERAKYYSLRYKRKEFDLITEENGAELCGCARNR